MTDEAKGVTQTLIGNTLASLRRLPDLRAAICADLGELGIALDPVRNEALRGAEGEISAAGSRAKVLVIPANEELVVARETVRCLQAGR